MKKFIITCCTAICMFSIASSLAQKIIFNIDQSQIDHSQQYNMNFDLRWTTNNTSSPAEDISLTHKPELATSDNLDRDIDELNYALRTEWLQDNDKPKWYEKSQVSIVLPLKTGKKISCTFSEGSDQYFDKNSDRLAKSTVVMLPNDSHCSQNLG